MLLPAQYAASPVTALLDEGAPGRLGLDQRWVHAIVDRGPDAVPELIEFGLNPPETARVDLTDDIVAVLRHLKDPRALGFYIELIRREPGEISDDVSMAVPEMGAACVEPLLGIFTDLEEDEAGDLVFLLASLGSYGIRDERILAILLDRLEYDMRDGALDLGLYGDPTALPALRKMLEEEPEDRDLLFAIQELEHAKTLEPGPAFDLWSSYPETAAPDFDAMMEADRLVFLEQGDEDDRIAAAASFFNEELSDDAEETLLKAARTDVSPKVRGEAWESLGSSQARGSHLEEIGKRLADPSAPAEERCGALVALSLDGDDLKLDLHQYLQEFYSSQPTRVKALEGMWRTLDRRYADLFVQHLEDPDKEIRSIAIRGVGHLGLKGEVMRLKKMFTDEDVREEALFAYAMAAPSELSAARMKSLLKRIGEETPLSPAEEELVMMALDERMKMAGKSPVFFEDPDESEEEFNK
jgi:HEAT repeat protein